MQFALENQLFQRLPALPGAYREVRGYRSVNDYRITKDDCKSKMQSRCLLVSLGGKQKFHAPSHLFEKEVYEWRIIIVG